MTSRSIEPRQPAHRVTVDERNAGQRIDNFLSTRLKGVPRARIYRILRRGEVRVNRGRIRQDYRLRAGDVVRIPPLARSAPEAPPPPPAGLLRELAAATLYEDPSVLVLDKPAGLSVHAGSGRPWGVIEGLRALRPADAELELVHRLDRDTSGCLLLARQRRALAFLHECLRAGRVEKRYLILVRGRWRGGAREVNLALRRGALSGGERMVRAGPGGKPAATVFTPLDAGPLASLLEARTLTGRTHQIRVHAAALGHPLAGDARYGDREFNRCMRGAGLRRQFLHAASVAWPGSGPFPGRCVRAPLAPALAAVLEALGLCGER